MAKREIVNEIHRAARRNFVRRSYEMRGIDDTFQADLIEMIPHSKDNKGYKYILSVIDIFSKYGWAIPLKNKSGMEVTNAMKKIFVLDHRVPRNIQTDNGKEFYNKYFSELMLRNNINHYSTFSKLKASIAERFNRTILTKLYKHFHFIGSYKWINSIQKIIDTYNNSKHRTIKMKPIEVNTKNEKEILATIYQKNSTFNEETAKFIIGDHVRISKHKTIFEKGYTPNWSTEIFIVEKILQTNPITYILKDMNNQKIQGLFYNYEMQKTKHANNYLVEKILKKKGNKVLVKWLGFNKEHNSWIKSSELIE